MNRRPTLEDANRYLDSLFKPSARSKKLWREHAEFVAWYREREQKMSEHDKHMLNEYRKRPNGTI